MGYDCFLKAINSLMGFPFFTHRDQAVKFIKAHNHGFNDEKASREKSQGGLKMKYFEKNFAISGNTAFKLRYLRSFNKYLNDSMPDRKPIGTLLRDYVDSKIFGDEPEYDRLLTVMSGKVDFYFLHAVAWIRRYFGKSK